MRIGLQAPLRTRDAYALKQRQGAPLCLGPREPVVTPQRLHDLGAQRVHRVQRQQGLLEHHRDHLAAKAGQLPLGHGQHITSGHADLPADLGAALIVQAQHAAQGHTLARTRFTDQRHHLATLHIQANATDGMHRFATPGEGHAEVAKAHHGLVGGRCQVLRRVGHVGQCVRSNVWR